MATVCGIGAAISKYPCIWCECPKASLYDASKEWSLTDIRKGARTVESMTNLAKRRGNVEANKSCKHEPLWPTIPIENVVIDTLHLFLRITDNLQNLLILELRQQDHTEKKITFTDLNMQKMKYMESFQTFVNDQCKINFQWFIDKETKKLKWRDFTGPEKLTLFSKINIPSLLPNFEQSDSIQKIWDSFMKIYKTLLMQTMNDIQLEVLKQDIKNWMGLFLEIYQTKHATPYMHALLQHVPEFIELHGSLVFLISKVWRS